MSHLRSLSPVVMCLLLVSLSGTGAWGETVGSGVSVRRKRAEEPAREVLQADYREPRALPRNAAPLKVTPRNRGQRSIPRASLASHEFGTMHKSHVRRTSTYDLPMDDEGIIEGESDDANLAYEEGCDSCGHGGCGNGSCGIGGCDDGVGMGWVGGSLIGRLLSRAEYASGVQSFSGPANRGGTGSFGFHEGINIGTPLFDNCWGLGMQGGVHFTQSNLNGAGFTQDSRNQVFATLGMFRRSDWGLQWGVAVDYMHDDWYYKVDLHQLRGELSWMLPDAAEIGFFFTNGLGTDTSTSTLFTNGIAANSTETWQITDMYAFFLRRTFENGMEGRLFAGFTGVSDGLIGSNLSMPLYDNWSLRTDFAYLMPSQGKLDNGFQQESWNVAMSVVWNPCCYKPCGNNYYRPLFNVANNNSLMVDRR